MAELKRPYEFRAGLPRPFSVTGSGIYAIVNRGNSKLYIGSAIRMNNRWCGHRLHLEENRHGNDHLQKAFNKSPENFYIEVVEELPNADRETLLSREQFWMNFYRSYEASSGYNIAPKAESCMGIKHPPEYGKRISDSMKGKPRSAAQIAADRARIGKKRPGMGRRFTQSQKDEQSRKFRGRKMPPGWAEIMSKRFSEKPPRQTPVNQYDLEGNFLARHRNIKDAEKAIGFPRCGVQEACKGRNTHCRGFQWRFADGPNGESNIGPKPKRRVRGSVVLQIGTDGAVKKFPSFKSAGRAVGLTDSAIHVAIRRGTKTAGFFWKRNTNE